MNALVDNTQYPFINRELSLLAFNRRVLAQATDEAVPLLERLRFLCIVSSNLDEFFEIRVAGLKEQIKLGSRTTDNDGLEPAEVLRRVALQAHALIAEQYSLLNDVIRAFKNTTYVAILGLFDVLGATKVALDDPAWAPYGAEAYLFIFLLYLLFCLAFSRWGMAVERRLARRRR